MANPSASIPLVDAVADGGEQVTECSRVDGGAQPGYSTGAAPRTESTDMLRITRHNAELREQLFLGPGLTVKQTMKGCCADALSVCCLGCADTGEFRIADYAGLQDSGETRFLPYKLYGIEESSACMRYTPCLIWGLSTARAMSLSVTVYNNADEEFTRGDRQAPRGAGGEQVVSFRKPRSCPVCFRFPLLCCFTYCALQARQHACPWVNMPTGFGFIPIACCCWLPSMEAYTPEGRYLGKSQYACDQGFCGSCCVPSWYVYGADGAVAYFVRPDTCCCGCCMPCHCGGTGGGCAYEPMLIRDAVSREPIVAAREAGGAGVADSPPRALDGDAVCSVTKVWAGMQKECCSNADNFALRWPDGVSADMKAVLLGLTFLVEFTLLTSKA